MACFLTECNEFIIYCYYFQLLANSQGQISIAAMNTVAEVLHKLLVVGITDTGQCEGRTGYGFMGWGLFHSQIQVSGGEQGIGGGGVLHKNPCPSQDEMMVGQSCSY